MVARVVCFLALCESLAGFAPAVRAPSPAAASRTTPAVMAAPAIIAKKSKVVDEVKAAMADTDLMFCVRSEGIPANDLNAMRQKLPPSVTMRCVKNTLVKRAAQDYPKFQGGDELLVYSNFFFFVPADQMRPTVDLWLDYVKVSKKEEYDIVGGVFDGQKLDKKGVIQITKLPTKQELMGQTAMLIKQLPTKLARSLNNAGAQRLAKVTKQASGQKLVQAVKAMEGKLE
eukprot:jgi/Chrpa1/9307/Chrysochromulina_OHIO_Genome00004406-RA